MISILQDLPKRLTQKSFFNFFFKQKETLNLTKRSPADVLFTISENSDGLTVHT
jgi:hypothetical protein